MLRQRLALIVPLAASFLAAPAAQTFTRVIGSGDGVPPSGTIAIQSITGTPAYGGRTLAFTELHQTTTGPIEVLWKRAGGTYQRVVGTGEPQVSWLGRSISSFGRTAVDRDGSVAFVAFSSSFGGFTSALFMDYRGAVSPRVRQGNWLPGPGAYRVNTFANQSLRLDDGYLAFSAQGRQGTSNWTGSLAVPVVGNQLIPLVVSGTTATGLGTFTGAWECDVRDGRVVFRGQVQTATGLVNGIYMRDADGLGPITTVVDTTIVNPVTGTPFLTVSDCQVDEDDVAFLGGETGGQLGLHTTFGAPLPATLTLPPGAGSAFSIGRAHMDHERLVFEVVGSGPARPQIGMFLSECGRVTKVLAPGDVLDGKTVQRISYGDEAMEGDEIALLVYFTDNSHAIYLVDLSTFTRYGNGLVGEGRFVPRIEGFDCPTIGSTFRIELRDASSSWVGALSIGLAPANIPVLGGTLLVSPAAVSLVTVQRPVPGMPRPWASLPLAVPAAPSLRGTTFYTQAAFIDFSAIQQVSFTPGMSFVVN